MDQYVFLFFLVIGACCCIYSAMIIPETKNKSFQEINMLFSKRNGIKVEEIDEHELQPLH